MLKGYDIVCFGPSDWWGMNPSSGTHIMRNLAKTNRVLYVNPISSDLLGIRGREGLMRRVVRKLASLVKFARRIEHNLYVLSPLFIPIQGNVVLDWMNNTLLKIQLGLFVVLLGLKKPLLWVENVRAADIINCFDWRLVIYHVSDQFDECTNTRNKTKLQQRESRITKNSDLIICVSRKLYESKKNAGVEVYYLPHGVDFEFFRKATEKDELYKGLAGVSGPIAGYFGTLTEQNDIELLEYCAANLPYIRFVFAGQITGGDYGKLSKMPNVIFLGHVPYNEIAKLCATFDVCLLPWRISKWIANCNPLKLLEYMACGKPVVSVPICEIIDKYSHIVSLAETKKQYCDAIVWELNNDTNQRRHLRIETAEKHSWDNHIEQLSEIISDAILVKSEKLTKSEDKYSVVCLHEQH